MQLPYSEIINIAQLGRVFDNMSESYKLFWFKAIITKLLEEKTQISYDELINEMISDAWYMVTEYHLNLGPKDNLDILVKYIYENTNMKPSENKNVILDYLMNCTDKEVKRLKDILIKNVPYRLQSPFMPEMRDELWYKGGNNSVIERINQQKKLMYYFDKYNGLRTMIRIAPEWISYIKENQEIIKGWLHYNMIVYLQRRNPSVPGIADKLYPPQERKLEKVKKYWRTIVSIQPIYEIYGNNQINTENISIDHFVPWSYVAHDELWNLHPTTKNINSSKSNNLPVWEKYFEKLCKQEYLSYQMIWQYDSVHKEYEACAKEHLNNWDIQQRLYREGLSEQEFNGQLEEILLPLYNSAKNCGFKNWIYDEIYN